MDKIPGRWRYYGVLTPIPVDKIPTSVDLEGNVEDSQKKAQEKKKGGGKTPIMPWLHNYLRPQGQASAPCHGTDVGGVQIAELPHTHAADNALWYGGNATCWSMDSIKCKQNDTPASPLHIRAHTSVCVVSIYIEVYSCSAWQLYVLINVLN